MNQNKNNNVRRPKSATSKKEDDSDKASMRSSMISVRISTHSFENEDGLSEPTPEGTPRNEATPRDETAPRDEHPPENDGENKLNPGEESTSELTLGNGGESASLSHGDENKSELSPDNAIESELTPKDTNDELSPPDDQIKGEPPTSGDGTNNTGPKTEEAPNDGTEDTAGKDEMGKQEIDPSQSVIENSNETENTSGIQEDDEEQNKDENGNHQDLDDIGGNDEERDHMEEVSVAKVEDPVDSGGQANKWNTVTGGSLVKLWQKSFWKSQVLVETVQAREW